MSTWFYALPLWQMAGLCLLGTVCWGYLSKEILIRNKHRAWMRVCWVLAVAYTVAILGMTVLNRSGDSAELILAPFNNFVEAKEQPEMYRSMLANVCLFVPLGAFVGSALAGSKLARSLKTRNIIALTIMIGLGVSIVIEIIQYAYGLGRAEVDDLLCNTVGMAVGSLSILFNRKK